MDKEITNTTKAFWLFKSLFVKYLTFFVLIAFLDNRFVELVIERSDSFSYFLPHLFNYVWSITLGSFFYVLVWIFPYSLLFKSNNTKFRFFAVAALVFLETFVYYKLHSESSREEPSVLFSISIVFIFVNRHSFLFAAKK